MDNIQDAYGVPNLYHKNYKQLIISSGQIRGGEIISAGQKCLNIKNGVQQMMLHAICVCVCSRDGRSTGVFHDVSGSVS